MIVFPREWQNPTQTLSLGTHSKHYIQIRFQGQLIQLKKKSLQYERGKWLISSLVILRKKKKKTIYRKNPATTTEFEIIQ